MLQILKYSSFTSVSLFGEKKLVVDHTFDLINFGLSSNSKKILVGKSCHGYLVFFSSIFLIYRCGVPAYMFKCTCVCEDILIPI